MILVRFGRFLASWRPWTRSKSFLDAIRFDSTVYEPVATLKTSNRLIFYVFRPPFRPTGSSMLMFFWAKRFFDEGSDPVRPIPQDPHRNSTQNDVPASSPSLFWPPMVTRTLGIESNRRHDFCWNRRHVFCCRRYGDIGKLNNFSGT